MRWQPPSLGFVQEILDPQVYIDRLSDNLRWICWIPIIDETSAASINDVFGPFPDGIPIDLLMEYREACAERNEEIEKRRREVQQEARQEASQNK